MIDQPKCEVCGQPATIIVQDVFVNENWETRLRELSPSGIFHFYCTDHEEASTFIDITESPLTWFSRKKE